MVCNIETMETQKISSDVYCMTFDILDFSAIMMNRNGAEEGVVYYYKNMETGSSPFYMRGELYRYDCTKQENIKIGSDVLWLTESSALKSGNLIGNDFTYQKFLSVEGDNVVVELMYYDGETSSKTATDLIS